MSNLKDEWKNWLNQKPEKAKVLVDDKVKAFGLKIVPSGNHKWISMKMMDSKRIWLTLGSIHNFNYKQALDAFNKTIHDSGVAEWINESKSGKGLPTLKEAVDIYYRKHGKFLKGTTIDDAMYCLHKVSEILPSHVKTHEVNNRDILHLKAKISSQATYNKCIAYLSSLWNLMNKWGYFPKDFNRSNPCTNADRFTIKPRKIFLTEDEAKKLWSSINIDSHYVAKTIIKLICLTGARKDEILSLRWENIDFKEGYITLTDTKNGNDHMIAINPMIHDCLRQLPKIGTSGFLFPSPTTDSYIQSIRKPFDRIKQRSGIRKEITLHDIRRTVATYLLSLEGVKLEDVSGALNHKGIDTTRRHYAFITEKNKAEVLKRLDALWNSN